MPRDILFLFLIALALFAMQAIGGVFQIRDYKKSIHRLHKLGNLGIGQKKGRMFNSYIVIIACDKNQMITGCEVLDGKTFLSKFHPQNKVGTVDIIGKSIIDLQAELRLMDKKEKKYKGYLQALYDLVMRFEHEKESQQAAMTSVSLVSQ